MSTTALNHPRRFLTPGPANKRKERDHFDALNPSTTKIAKPSTPRAGSASTPRAPEPVCNNQLLAGYLAYEFLTKGTLFGEPWDPARAEAVPLSAGKMKCSQKGKASVKAEPQMEKYQRYVEVADLLKTDGAHLPGIVNPTQLARFFQL